MSAITLLQPFNLDSTKDYTFATVSANIKTDNLLFANGSPYVFITGPAGTNTQVQFNDANSLGASANFTFNTSSNTLTVTNITANGAGLTSLTGANVTGTVANATYAITAGAAYSVSGSNVSGQVGNALLAGTVYTNAQPNITSVGTLTNLTVSGNANVTTNLNVSGDAVVTGNLVVQGNTQYTNVDTLIIEDPVIEMGGGPNGAPLTTNDGKDRGSLLHYYSGAPIDAFMGWDNSNAEFGFGSNVSITNDLVTFDHYGNIRAAYFIGDGSRLSNLQIANASVANANYSIYAGTAYNVSGSNVSGDVSGANHANIADLANSVSGSNVTGQVGNALIAGTVYTNAQPNITSFGTLSGLTVNGTTNLGSASNVKITGGTAEYVLKTDGAGNLSWTPMSNANVGGSSTQIQYNNGTNLAGSANLTFNAGTKTLSVDNIIANGSQLTNITGANVTGYVPNANVANTAYSVSGANVSGDVSGANHANVADVANSVLGSNVTGTVANATYATTAGTAYNVSGANVSGDVSGANHANVADVANTVAGANVTGTVANAVYAVTSGTSYSVTGSNVSGPVAYATTANSVAGANVSGQVSNALVAGTVYTNAQPNITSLGTLSSLTVTANVSSGNADLGNAATASFFIGNGVYLTSITGANVIGDVANATYAITAGTAYNVSGSNVSGYVSDATHATVANTANSVSAANISGQVANALVAGTVYTAAQPNITSVGTLTNLVVSGNANITTDVNVSGNATITGNLVVQGTTSYVNVTQLIIEDPLIQLGSGPNGAPLTSNDGKDRGMELHYYSGSDKHAFIGWDNSNAEFAFGSEVTVSSDVVTYIAFGNVRANVYIGDGGGLSNIPGANVSGPVAYATVANSVAGSNVSGEVAFAAVANSVSGSNVSGPVAYATTANSVAGANVSGAVAYATTANSVAGANVSGQVANALVAGTVYTAAQPNITSLGTLVTLDVSSNITSGNVYANTGTVGASLLTGTLTTAAQPNITSLGTLSGLTVSGTTSLTGANVSLGAISNLHISGGTANYVLKTDGSGSLSWVAQTQASSITVDNFTGNGVQTTFTLSTTPISVNNVLVNINGASQLRESYSLSGADIIFGSPPPNTSKVEVTTLGLTAPGASGFAYAEVTANATATARNRYIVNTGSANLTVTLPNSPSLGDEIGIIDGTGNASSHAITVARNGQKINGATSDYTISTNRGTVNLVYYNSAQGWIIL